MGCWHIRKVVPNTFSAFFLRVKAKQSSRTTTQGRRPKSQVHSPRASCVAQKWVRVAPTGLTVNSERRLPQRPWGQEKPKPQLRRRARGRTKQGAISLALATYRLPRGFSQRLQNLHRMILTGTTIRTGKLLHPTLISPGLAGSHQWVSGTFGRTTGTSVAFMLPSSFSVPSNTLNDTFALDPRKSSVPRKFSAKSSGVPE